MMGDSGGATRHEPIEQRLTPNGQDEVIDRLRRKVEDLERRVETWEKSPEPEVRMAAPFTPSVIDASLPRDFWLPTIKAYKETSDPRTHMTRYKAAMVMIGADDVVMCRAFLSSLDGTAQDWFNTLRDGSIRNFGELSKRYLSNNIQWKKHFSYLCSIRQTRGKSLRDFVAKWKKEVNDVYDIDGRAAVPIFTQALRSGDFYKHLNAHPPQSYKKLMRTANKFAEAKETDRRKREEEKGRGGGKSEKGSASQATRSAPALPSTPERPRLMPLHHLTPLTHPVSVILDQAEEMGLVQFSKECIKVSPNVDPS